MTFLLQRSYQQNYSSWYDWNTIGASIGVKTDLSNFADALEEEYNDNEEHREYKSTL